MGQRHGFEAVCEAARGDDGGFRPGPYFVTSGVRGRSGQTGPTDPALIAVPTSEVWEAVSDELRAWDQAADARALYAGERLLDRVGDNSAVRPMPFPIAAEHLL